MLGEGVVLGAGRLRIDDVQGQHLVVSEVPQATPIGLANTVLHIAPGIGIVVERFGTLFYAPISRCNVVASPLPHFLEYPFENPWTAKRLANARSSGSIGRLIFDGFKAVSTNASGKVCDFGKHNFYSFGWLVAAPVALVMVIVRCLPRVSCTATP